jgi:hypothetical protein
MAPAPMTAQLMGAVSLRGRVGMGIKETEGKGKEVVSGQAGNNSG